VDVRGSKVVCSAKHRTLCPLLRSPSCFPLNKLKLLDLQSLKEKADAQEALRQCQVALADAQKRVESLEKTSRDLTAAHRTKNDEIKRLTHDLDAVCAECNGVKAELALVPTRIEAAVAAAKSTCAEEYDAKLRVRCLG
jgi:septal ring factor EnvC (AmiA/AmiB activator)